MRTVMLVSAMLCLGVVGAEARSKQFTIDKGRCLAVANGSVAMPPGAQPSSTYRITGATRSYGIGGSRTSTLNATAQPQGGFATGFANGLSMGNQMKAAADRKSVYRGCMAERGW